MIRRGALKSKSVGRSPGVTNYTKEKIDTLLEIVENKIPVTSDEWESTVQEYNVRTTDDRDAESIRRKFRDLANLKKITPSTITPEQIDRAKGLYSQVRDKYAVITAAEEAKLDADKTLQSSMVDENGEPIQIPGLDPSLAQSLSLNSSAGTDSSRMATKKFKGMGRISLDSRISDVYSLANTSSASTSATGANANDSVNSGVTRGFLHQLSEQMMMMFTMLQSQAQQQQQQFMAMMQQQNVLLAAVLSESRKRKAAGAGMGDIAEDMNEGTEEDPEMNGGGGGTADDGNADPEREGPTQDELETQPLSNGAEMLVVTDASSMPSKEPSHVLVQGHAPPQTQQQQTLSHLQLQPQIQQQIHTQSTHAQAQVPAQGVETMI